jgi:hypothetical protein
MAFLEPGLAEKIAVCAHTKQPAFQGPPIVPPHTVNLIWPDGTFKKTVVATWVVLKA